MDAYLASVENGTAAVEGWPAWIEVASRAGQIAAMRCLARALDGVREERGSLVNAVCSEPVPEPGAAGTVVGEVRWAATQLPGTREPYGRMLHRRTALPCAYAG